MVRLSADVCLFLKGSSSSCSSVELLRAEQPTACLLGTVSAASCVVSVPGSQHLFAWLLCSAPFVLLFAMCLFARTMCCFVRTCVACVPGWFILYLLLGSFCPFVFSGHPA